MSQIIRSVKLDWNFSYTTPLKSIIFCIYVSKIDRIISFEFGVFIAIMLHLTKTGLSNAI
jgi:hypothetical protein